MPGDIHSKAQARYLGAVASGSVKKSGLAPSKAREMLHANKGRLRRLPERVPAQRAAKRISRRGRR